jgi:hypothetical protein
MGLILFGLRSILFGSHRLPHDFSQIHVGHAMSRGPQYEGVHMKEMILYLSFLQVAKSLMF